MFTKITDYPNVFIPFDRKTYTGPHIGRQDGSCEEPEPRHEEWPTESEAANW